MARKGLCQSDVAKLLQCDISDFQAECSDFGGDSDAEDVDVSVSTCTTRPNLRDHDYMTGTLLFPENDSDASYVPSDDESESDSSSNENNSSFDSSSENSDASCSSDEPENELEENYKWNKKGGNPELFSSNKFTEKCAANEFPDADNIKSPLAYFLIFFTEAFLLNIISESNLYATQCGKQLNLGVDDLKAFLGILIIMGFHQLPSIRLYWSRDENFHFNRISRIMPVKRFLKILRYLHLNDNKKMPKRGEANFDKLYKIRPLMEHLSEKFSTAFSPSRYISIDESMVAFKGRTSLKQYMPMKPIKRGFKVWVLSCAATGFMLAFEVYSGKDPTGTVTTNLGESVVLNLSQVLRAAFYCLFFDNFFSSVPLMKELLRRKLFACGTIRQNRKFFPKEHLKKDTEMKRLETDYAMAGDISIVKWRDRGKKPVCVISTMHNPTSTTTVPRKNEEGVRENVPCTQAIFDYNKYMGGVDTFDQHISVYSIAQKSRRWWLKLFYYFTDCAIVNAFILYKQVMAKNKEKHLSHLNFRSTLANELIGAFSCKKRTGYFPYSRSNRKRKGSSVQNNIRFESVGAHLPELSKTYRRCANCSTKEKEKRSNMICKTCQVALCRGCFTPFHKP